MVRNSQAKILLDFVYVIRFKIARKCCVEYKASFRHGVYLFRYVIEPTLKDDLLIEGPLCY